MKFNYFASASPASKVLLTVFISVVCLLLSLVVAIIFAIPIFHASPYEIIYATNNLSDPRNIAILKYLQVIQATGMFIIPSFIAVWLFGENVFSFLKLQTKPKIIHILLVICIMVVLIPAINFIAGINEEMKFPSFLKSLENWMKLTEVNAARITEAFMKVNSYSGLLFNIFLMALLPALGEELLFRGVLQKLLDAWFKNIHVAILSAAILFSFLHMQFYGFVPRMLLGALFGYLLIWSGSLWLPIFAHFVNNAMAVIFYYFSGKGIIGQWPETIGRNNETIVYTIMSLVVSSLLIFLIYRHRKLD
jgi:hypothetical protein